MTSRLTIALLCLWPCLARAAGDDFRLDVAPAPKPLPAAPANPFAKGTWTLQAEGSYTAPIRYSTSDHATGTVGVGYYLWDDTAITFLAHGFHVSQEDDHDTDGGGVSVMGRTHLLHFGGDRLSLYIDGGGGYAWGNGAFPVGGTTYNFTARVGPGLSFRLAEHAHLIGGARYFHNSNGQQHGREKNPGYDGIECYVGLLFTFR